MFLSVSARFITSLLFTCMPECAPFIAFFCNAWESVDGKGKEVSEKEYNAASVFIYLSAVCCWDSLMSESVERPFHGIRGHTKKKE